MSNSSVVSDRISPSFLVAMAMRQPHTRRWLFRPGRDRAGRVRYTHLTYRQLDQDSDRIALGLAAAGIERGTRAVLLVRPGLDFFSLVFALFKAGVVPVLIDPGIGLRNLGAMLPRGRAEVFIGIPRASGAQLSSVGPAETSVAASSGSGPAVPNLRRSRHSTTCGAQAGRPSLRTARPAPFVAFLAPDETAAILFTSGSTGSAQGGRLHARDISGAGGIVSIALRDRARRDRPLHLPLFALFAPALGMTAIVPDMDPTRPARVNPARIFEAIDDFGVTNLFGSPALLRRLAQGGKSSRCGCRP